jgi:hypothetical protein
MADYEQESQIIPFISDEELVQKRQHYHDNLGRVSIKLAEITADWHMCVQELMATNEELRRRGIDTSSLERSTTYSPIQDDTIPLLQSVVNL